MHTEVRWVSLREARKGARNGSRLLRAVEQVHGGAVRTAVAQRRARVRRRGDDDARRAPTKYRNQYYLG